MGPYYTPHFNLHPIFNDLFEKLSNLPKKSLLKKPSEEPWFLIFGLKVLESKKFTILTPYNIPPFKNKNDLIFSFFGLLTLEMAILGQNLGRCPRALVMDLGWIFLAWIFHWC